jgi:arginase family enzyme
MFLNYFNPVDEEIFRFKQTLNQNNLGYDIDCYYTQFPDFSKSDFALIFVPDNRGSVSCDLSHAHLQVRKAFYNLFKGNWNLKIVDFGNLNLGKDLGDTYFAINDIVSNLISQSVFPIIIGGGHDLTYPIYQSYQSFTKGVNILCVDSKFDLINDVESINSGNFLGSILKKDPNHLNNFVNLGYQKYLCQNDESHLVEKMLFETCRLGDLRGDVKEAEPYIRASDIVSFDLSVVKCSDAPNSTNPSPNGIDAHHACVISRYAGMSDRVSSFGIFELAEIAASYSDIRFDSTVSLVAQILWHFLEGFSLRINDTPSVETLNNNYQKYLIPIPDTDLQYVFYKSKVTNRWWVSSSMDFDSESSIREHIVPCSYEDYLQANSGEISKRIHRLLKLKS